jgi:hypothetical protein
MFWIIEPLERGDHEPDGAAPTAAGALTWHNGRTAGYSAFLGVARAERRGVAVLADSAHEPEQQRIALELLGCLSGRR